MASVVYQDSWEDFQGTWALLDDIGCDTDETYMTDGVLVSGLITQPFYDGSYITEYSIDYMIGQALNTRYCGYIQEYHNGYGDYSGIIFVNTGAHYTNNQSSSIFPFYTGNSSYFPNSSGSISINIPIFFSQVYANEYMNPVTTTERRKELIHDYTWNYKSGETVPEGKMFNIYNPWQHGTWDEYSDIKGPTTDGIIHYRNVRGKLIEGKKFGLYKIGLIDGAIRMGIKYDTGAFYSLQYSEDGITWHDTDSFPYTFLYAPRTIETGTFDYGLTIGNDIIPIWETEEDVDDYLSGDKDISEASNWGSISNQYGERILNLTGEEEQLTEFGELYTRQFFTQCYLCNTGVLYDVSNALFDYDVTTLSGLWEDIKKGLEMYGSNPMEVVQGVRFYPFDLSQIFSDVQSQNYIYFGAYKLDLTSGNALKVIYANGYKDMGTVRIKRTFNDWRDFEPYTKLSIYLPYIGRYTLDAARYYDKEVTIRYYLDIRTGMCCACLIANGVLLDWFDGQIGVEMPITLTDYSSYAQTQINTILRNASLGTGGAATTIGAGVKSYHNMMHAEENYDASHPQAAKTMNNLSGMSGPQAMMGAHIGATVAATGIVAAGTAMKTAYDLMKTGTSAYTGTKGSSSAMVNAFLPQYPTFMFEISEIDESPYLNELYGRPTNASGRLGDFTGYLEADDIMLICPIATDNERQEIIDLVRSGIYI